MLSVQDRPVRLAILGAGTIGTIHALCSLEAPEATVTAVWSHTYSRAQALAQRLDCAAYASLEEAVTSPDVDAVLVCTPTFLHEEHALKAIAAGKHVICEKPLARDLPSASRLIAAAQQAGVLLLVAHVVRFSPDFCQLRDAVRAGAVGQPAVVRMSRASSFPHGSQEWHNQPALSGGVVLDMGIHDLDWLLWTFGPARRVYAKGLYGRGLDCLDYALLTIRLQNETIAHVECSWAEPEGFRVHGEIAGDAGLLDYDSLNSTALSIDLRQPPETPPGVNVPTSFTAESPYVTQLRHFCRCIQGQEQPLITPQEAYESLRLALAALESITTNRPVQLDEEADPCASA
ncbi:MAG: Gfo/Idh/MocA family oxidoreductase [Chloroflexi bacterium]|nr:Gfo/Idh/MocA family oxidoreductase [Chloroflexota bacterium]